MITLQRNKQRMFYSNMGEIVPVYETDDDGNIRYYVDEDGNEIPLETGDTKISYSVPVGFKASINNKLDQVLVQEFGIDDSTKYAQIVIAKGYLPVKVGSLIWKRSEIGYDDSGIPDETTADYIVKGIADEGLNFDLFLLQRNVK